MNPGDKPPTLDGWNDPPANLALSENMSTKRVLLNKRVAYTNQPLATGSTPSAGLSAPPPVMTSVPAVASATSPPAEDEASLKTELLSIEEIDGIFRRQLDKLETTSSVEKKILDDITKKFQVMQEEWSQDKLSANTKQTLSSMFRELDADHVQQAFDMHVTLVRNASSEVVRFIVGIKRLIQELQRLTS